MYWLCSYNLPHAECIPYAAWSMMRLTLRRSMLSHGRWRAGCDRRCARPRTVCSTLGASGSAGGASPSVIGYGWWMRAADAAMASAGLSVLMSVIRSSKEPARAGAGQALTRAPMGPWPRPCARLAPIVARMPAPRHQRARGDTGRWRRLASRRSMLAARIRPSTVNGHSHAGLAVGADQLVGVAVGDDRCHRGDGGHGGSGGDRDERVSHARPFLDAASGTTRAPSRDLRPAMA
jgi:hypothetical protein